MDRLQEVEHKHAQLRALMEQHGADAIWLRRARNVVWFTAGADPVIAADGENGAYSVLVTPNARSIITDPIEAPRIQTEEQIEDLGFTLTISPWYQPVPPHTPHLATDDGAVGEAIAALRRTLTPSEQGRARQIGRETGEAVEEAARAARPGDTEYQIAARISAACRARGGLAIVTLVAADARTLHYRHAYATAHVFEKYAMLVVCNRRCGLVISATRFVHVGEVPSEIMEKLHKVAAIDAAAIVGTRPGRTLGDVFADIQAAYAAQGEADQWQYHHQGGLAGYAAREVVATPGDPTMISDGQLFAWNPSIPGCKSEDTILTLEGGFEIVTQTDSYPLIEVTAAGQAVKRPAILAI